MSDSQVKAPFFALSGFGQVFVANMKCIDLTFLDFYLLNSRKHYLGTYVKGLTEREERVVTFELCRL